MDVPGTPKLFHDVAGVVMMPGAVLLLFGKIWLMDRLVVPESAVRQKPENIVTRKRIMNSSTDHKVLPGKSLLQGTTAPQ